MRHSVVLAAAALAAAAGAAQAANTDLQVLSTTVIKYTTFCTGNQPVAGSNTCFQVVIRNNGPDTYTSSGPGPNKVLAGGRPPKVTVDIDEPTDPNRPGLASIVFTKTDSFFVTLGAGASTAVFFNASGYVPSHAGSFSAISTVAAQGSNIDGVPGNNTLSSPFTVGAGSGGPPPITPALGVWGLALGGLALLGLAARRLRGTVRRRAGP